MVSATNSEASVCFEPRSTFPLKRAETSVRLQSMFGFGMMFWFFLALVGVVVFGARGRNKPTKLSHRQRAELAEACIEAGAPEAEIRTLAFQKKDAELRAQLSMMRRREQNRLGVFR
jgi:hypothetical protein